jgi:hypothetical protein
MNLLLEIRELILSLVYLTLKILKNQWLIIRRSYLLLLYQNKGIKESFYIFFKWLKIYRKLILIINILALLNLLFTIFIIITFSNLVELNELFPIIFLNTIFVKFAPVFIQEFLLSYYFTITNLIKFKIAATLFFPCEPRVAVLPFSYFYSKIKNKKG